MREPFGHSGAGGSYGFADPERGLAVGYVMNKMSAELLDPRPHGIVSSIYPGDRGGAGILLTWERLYQGQEKRGIGANGIVHPPPRDRCKGHRLRGHQDARTNGRTSCRRSATPSCAGQVPSPPGRVTCSTSTAKGCSTVPVAEPSCSTPIPSSTRGRGGRASTGRRQTGPSSSGRTAATGWSGRRSSAPRVAATSGMCSPTAPPTRACATA